MKKENSNSNEFNHYIFNLTLDNQLHIYPSYFNMCSFYIHNFDDINHFQVFSKENVFNISIHNQTFNYINTSTGLYNKTYASVGISKNFSNFNEFSKIKEYNKTYFCFLDMIAKEQEKQKSYEGSFISFVHKENDEAEMTFGEEDTQFDTGISHQCQSEYGYYFSCQVSSVKIGVNEIYSPSTARKEIGIFSISDEYIILPNKAGNETIFYYTKKIKELFSAECKDESKENDEMINITCEYFNYDDLPDLYFEMKGGIGVMALSVDMFKILPSYKMEFKLKYRKKNDGSVNNKWILGEPVTKNYNFLVNYKDKEKPYLIIVSSSLNGFILILVATIGGFVFLFIFLTIIYCSARKENKLKNNFYDNKNNNLRKNFFSIDKNYISDAIEEHENEKEENEKDEDDFNSLIYEDNDNDKNEINTDNIISKEAKEEYIEKDEEMKNLMIDDLQNENIINNKKKINEKDINNSGEIKINNNNIGMELITNKTEDIPDEKDSLM
jgi:hypothetical protein